MALLNVRMPWGRRLSRVFAALLANLVLVVALPANDIRVVSQSIGTDELLLALARPEQVAALSHIAHDPSFSAVAEEASKYPAINQGDAETILRFRPTLVLFTDFSRPELVAQVRRTGVEVLIFDRYATIEDTYRNLRTLGAKLGASDRAAEIIEWCEARVADLDRRLAGVEPVRVIAPSTYGIMSGSGTTFQDLCEHAGAENVAATVGDLRGHATAPVEQMLTWPVDAVVLTGASLEETLAIFRNLPPYQFMNAVVEGRAVLLEPHMLSCVSHHRIDAYEMLARGLHPSRFVEATGDN